MENGSRRFVPALLTIELGERRSPFGFVIQNVTP
jgi:hypothetical protein